MRETERVQLGGAPAGRALVAALHSQLDGRSYALADLRKGDAVRIAGIHPRIDRDFVMRNFPVESGRVDEDVADVDAIIFRDQALLRRHRDLEAIRVGRGEGHLAQLLLARHALDRFLIFHARCFFALQRGPAECLVGPFFAKHFEIVVDDRDHDLLVVAEVVGELCDAADRAKVGGHLVEFFVGRGNRHGKNQCAENHRSLLEGGVILYAIYRHHASIYRHIRDFLTDRPYRSRHGRTHQSTASPSRHEAHPGHLLHDPGHPVDRGQSRASARR